MRRPLVQEVAEDVVGRGVELDCRGGITRAGDSERTELQPERHCPVRDDLLDEIDRHA